MTTSSGTYDPTTGTRFAFRSLLITQFLDFSRVQKTRARVPWLSRTLSTVQSPDTSLNHSQTPTQVQIAPLVGR